KYFEENISVKELSNAYNVPAASIYNWVSTYKKSKNFTGSGNGQLSTETQLKRLELEKSILQDALFIDKDKSNIFEFIYLNKEKYPISTMCELINVSISGYYKYAKNVTSTQEMQYIRIVRLVKETYLYKGPNITIEAITNIINADHNITSTATVARILKKYKSEWNTSFSQFHDDNDVNLIFHNKDTIFDIANKRYLNEKFAKKEIKQFFEDVAFTNFKRHQNNRIQEVSGFDITDNLLINADNLHALYHLREKFKRKVKLIYIDVPFNTRRYNLSYTDSLSRSDYLTFMKNRIDLAKDLLKSNGSIFIHCDDSENAYLKVLCDEIFGHENFVNQIIWQSTFAQQNRSHIATKKNYILVYAKNKSKLQFNQPLISNDDLTAYKYSDENGMFKVAKLVNNRNGYYQFDITTPENKVVNYQFDITKQKFEQLLQNDELYWSRNHVPYKKTYLNDYATKIVNDLWTDPIQYGSNQAATKELDATIPNNNFTHPKPLKLLEHIIKLASNEKDIVLDFFGGSGTTAVAATMLNRQFITIELDKNNFELITKRLKKTIDSSVSFITCRIC